MMRRGQSLMEILVGVALGAVLIIAAAAAIAPALQENKQVSIIQTRTEVANETISNLRAWAGGSWNGVLTLATGTTNLYYLNSATSSFSAATGTQSVAVGSTTYIRSFYLSDVYRDSNGNVTTTASGNSYDPSTKAITVVVSLASSTTPSSTYVFYLTRNGNNAFNQTSWSGGSGQSGSVTLAGTTYASSTQITVNSTGSIELSNGGLVCIY